MPDFSNFISRSIAVVKRQKWLIVYGLVLSVYGAGGGSSSSNFSSDDIDGFKQFWEKSPEESGEKFSQVLGTATSAISDWFSSVSPSTWVAVVLLALIIVLVAIIVSLIIKSWAKGALIYGVDKALIEEDVNLANTSPSGIYSIKNLIILSLIATGMGILVFFVVPAIGVALFFILRNVPPLHHIWLFFGIILGIFFFIFAALIFAMIGVYAERLIVLKNYNPWDAWKKGFSLSKNNFFPTLVMGIINNILSSMAGCLAVIISLLVLGGPAFILIRPLFTQQRLPSVYEIASILLLLIIFSAFSRLVSGILIVFKYANWGQLYNSVIEKIEENGKQ